MKNCENVVAYSPLAVLSKGSSSLCLRVIVGFSHVNSIHFDPPPHAKSLYRSRAGRYFHRNENVIWACFGPVGNTEKKIEGRL